MGQNRDPARRTGAKLLASALIVLMVATVVSSSYVAAVRADGSPTFVSISYSGSLSVSTSMTADEGFEGSQAVSFTETRQSTYTASFDNLTLVGMVVNGSEVLGGVANATFSSADSWSLTPHASGNLQVSLDPPSGNPSWSSTGVVFGAINGSQAFFLLVPSTLPPLINVSMTITDTQATTLPPQVYPLLMTPPAFDGFGVTLYAAIGGPASDLPTDPSAILSYILAYGQLTTSDPTEGHDIQFSGNMPSSPSFGGTAYVSYNGDLSLTVLNVQSSTPQTSYTLDLKSGSGGTTNPLPGNYTQAAGTSLDVTALPNSTSSFSYWLLDGDNVGSSNPYSVSFDGDHVLQPVFEIGPGGQSGRTVVINPNNWAEYSVSVSTSGSGLTENFTDLMNVTSVKGTVVGVQGSVATIGVGATFANGTTLSFGDFTIDVDSGYTSSGGFGAFIIGSGLGTGDQVFTSSQSSLLNATINGTTTWTENGYDRTALHLTSDALGEYFWDRGTGLLLHAEVPIYSGNQAAPVGSVTYALTSTSLFAGGSGPTTGSPWSFLLSPNSTASWIEIILVFALIILALVVISRALSRRRKKEGVPPATFSKNQARKEEGGVVAPPRAPADSVTGAPPPKFTFCPNCGRTLPSQLSKFCPFCGFSLSEQGASKPSG